MRDEHRLEREGAAEHEGDQIVAPQIGDIAGRRDRLAIAKHHIFADIGPQIQILGQLGQERRSRPRTSQDRQRLRIGAAIGPEIPGMRRRHDHQIALHKARRHMIGEFPKHPRPDRPTHRARIGKVDGFDNTHAALPSRRITGPGPG